MVEIYAILAAINLVQFAFSGDTWCFCRMNLSGFCTNLRSVFPQAAYCNAFPPARTGLRISCRCHSQQFHPESWPQTLQQACPRVLARPSGQESCWRALQKGLCQRSEQASLAQWLRPGSVWARGHTECGLGWPHKGWKWCAWPCAVPSWNAMSSFCDSGGGYMTPLRSFGFQYQAPLLAFLSSLTLYFLSRNINSNWKLCLKIYCNGRR